jgi:hypothetical protein
MKFKEYLALLTDPNGYFPTPHLRRVIRKNDRPTAREEAIAAKVIEEANPRENITGHYPWAAEEQFVLQQLWIRESPASTQWRDVTTEDNDLFTVEDGLPIPNAVKQPEVLEMDLHKRLREILGNDG